MLDTVLERNDSFGSDKIVVAFLIKANLEVVAECDLEVVTKVELSFR